MKDMGTPERYMKVKNDIRNGKVSRLNKLFERSALFIDRDNTIINCKEKEYITSLEQVSLIEANINKILEIRKLYDHCYIITNQPQVSMGYINYDMMTMINGKVIELCAQKGLMIDGFYACIHHEDKGYDGEIRALKQSCFCRKPSPGLILQACFENNLSLASSMMIGDSWRDRKVAENMRIEYIDIRNL